MVNWLAVALADAARAPRPAQGTVPLTNAISPMGERICFGAVTRWLAIKPLRMKGEGALVSSGKILREGPLFICVMSACGSRPCGGNAS